MSPGPGKRAAHPLAALVLVAVWLALVVPALVAMPARSAAQADQRLSSLQAWVDGLALDGAPDGWRAVLAMPDCPCATAQRTALEDALGAPAVYRASPAPGLPALTLVSEDGRIAYAGGFRMPLGCGGDGPETVTVLKSSRLDADIPVVDATTRCRCP